MKYKLIIIIFIFFGIGLYSQDIHFSQFNENPALINPALTGALSPLRVSITNRDQWRSVAAPYQTYGANIETRFKSDSWQKVENKSMTFKERSLSRLAAGLSFYKDKAGNGNLGQTQGNLSLASFVTLNKNNFISVGLQGSIVQRMLNNSSFIFPDQYTGTTYDPNQSSKEIFTNLKFTYFDLGTGAQWTYSKEQKNMNSDKQFTSHLGFAVFHLSQPRQQYLGTLSKLQMRYVSHGDIITSLGSSNMAISPSYLLQLQGSSKEIIIGAMLKHYLNSSSKYTGLVMRNSFGYGLYYRNNDAILFSALFELQQKYAVILSYDFNISRLAPSSSFRGGFEITLRYTSPKPFLYQMK